MSKNSFAIRAAVMFHPIFKKTVPVTYLEVTGPDAKTIVESALGEKSRGDVQPNAEGTGLIVTGLSEKAAMLALENCALVDAGESPQRKTAAAKDDDASDAAQAS